MDENINDKLKFLEKIIAKSPGNLYWKNKEGVYLGCNDAQAKFLGFASGKEIIGKTDYDLPWRGAAEALRANDLKVIETREAFTQEEPVTLLDGSVEIFYSTKEALLDDDGNVIGIVGTSLNITALKRAEEREKKAIEDAVNANAKAQEQEKFAKTADQVAHDIRSPLASLLMIIKSCNEIPETERVALREAAVGIGDIANSLLAKYKAQEDESSTQTENRQSILLSATLLQILTDKKFQYKELPVKFQHNFHTAGQFAFSKIELSSFKRMMSNLINNAVDAFEKKEGQVTLELDATEEHVYVKVIDNGKGMPSELVEKIMQKIAVTEGKSDGHGIGLTQVRETLERNEGKLSIHSVVGEGTQIVLEFPRIKAPHWIADKIILNPQDIVVILDDDASIHFAWDARFEEIIEKSPKLRVKHFNVCQEAIDFINNLNEADYKKVFLLTDFELLKQELNGLHVVEKTKIERSILVTSHYTNIVVYERAIKIGTKILPKQLASEIPIYIDHTIIDEESEPQKEESKKVDLILVDDNETFAQTLIDFIFDQDVVDYYRDPRKLLANLTQYPKDTRIYLDNNFTMVDELGVDIAKNLHELGFTRLYLLSGDTFKSGEIPEYLKVIVKTDIDKIRDW